MATVTAQDGDTWDSIAADNDVPVAMLLMANGIDPSETPDSLEAGSTIRLPDPPPDLCVAPDHDHTTDIATDTRSIWVRLDMSAEDARNDPGSLRLYSTDGTYDSTVPIAASFVASSTSVDVPFDDVDPTLDYSLEYRGADNRVVLIVCERTIDAVQDGDSSG